jgi:outer membrane protein assembly factor BamB
MKACFVRLIALSAIAFSSVYDVGAADWPQWRGPERDGLSRETGLLKEWPADGPKVVWQVEGVGAGYSTISVADGRIFTQGNVEDEGRIQCLDERTGKTLWSVRSPAEKEVFEERRGNGPRGAPTVDGDRVYVEGGGGDLTCLDLTGRVVWSLHLLRDLNGGERPPKWGFSESPLVDGDKLIVTPGGNDGAVAALDKRTGDVIWRSADVTDKAHYSSPIVVDVGGTRQIIQFTSRRVVGLDAETGKLLWDYAASANGTANVATPIYHDGHVFTSSAYGTGGGLVKLVQDGGAWKAEEVYFSESMANHHGGIVLLDGFLYGFGSNVLICMDYMTGEIAWRDRSVGKGSLTSADGHLYCLGEKNQAGLVEANPKEYVEKGRFELPESGWPTWAHPVVANGALYLRDQGTLTKYDVRAE